MKRPHPQLISARVGGVLRYSGTDSPASGIGGGGGGFGLELVNRLRLPKPCLDLVAEGWASGRGWRYMSVIIPVTVVNISSNLAQVSNVAGGLCACIDHTLCVYHICSSQVS